MKYNPSTFTDFVDKEAFFQEALKHIETINPFQTSKKNDTLYLWATELPNNKIQLKTLSDKEQVKNILLSSASQANPAIRRIYDQILFDADRKFGGSSELTLELISKLTKSFVKNHKGVFFTDKVKDWSTILFEKIIPKVLAEKSLPNNANTFAETFQGLYEKYDDDLVDAVIQAVLLAGSGGNIIVQQSPYFGKFSVVHGESGYQFKTFEQSKMFAGLSRFKQDKAVGFTNPKILLVNGAVEDFSEIEELLDEAAMKKQPLIVIAERISDEIFDVFKLNFDKSVVDCFAIETKKDYTSVNTIMDIGVIAESNPITPYTIHSEFLMAKWESLPVIDEIVVSKDGKVTIKNKASEISVRNHIKKVAAKRQELSADEFSIKEPNLTARIQNLTTSPTYLYVPYKTETEGETKRIMVDTLLRYLKSVISYGVIKLDGSESELLLTALVEEIDIRDKDFFDKHKWYFKELLQDMSGLIPYLHIVGARRLIANHMTQIFGVQGMIITVE